MREIEFRGKCLDNGEWVKGWLTYNRLDNLLNRIDTKECCYCVIPETVGQYTGLKDKNGVKIFEGDIVKFTEFYNWNGKERHTGVVCWRDCCYWINSSAVFELKDIHTQDHEFEIIGNIHDNPELLKEAINA